MTSVEARIGSAHPSRSLHALIGMALLFLGCPQEEKGEINAPQAAPQTHDGVHPAIQTQHQPEYPPPFAPAQHPPNGPGHPPAIETMFSVVPAPMALTPNGPGHPPASATGSSGHRPLAPHIDHELNRTAPSFSGDGPGQPPSLSADWSEPMVLEQAAHRPQLAVDRAGGIHLVYYARQGNTQAIAYRYRKAHGTWTPLEWLEAKDGNSLGPDLVLDANGMPWITFDHTLEDGTGRVFVAHRTRAGWSQLEQVSTTEKAEVSSAHLALDATGALTVVWLERPLEPGHFMQIHSRTRSRSGRWGTTERVEAHRFDAWHPNIVANPRGLQLMGFDLSLGPDRHQVQVREKRDGSWLESLVLGDSQTGGQRPNLAIDGKGVAHVVWTAIQGPFRLGVYYSRGYSNQGHWRWTKPKRITAGISGFHYDPDVAIDPSGQARALWSWYDRGKTGVLSMMLEAGSAVPALITSEGKAGYSCLAAGPDGHFYAAWNDGGSGRLYFVESTGS